MPRRANPAKATKAAKSASGTAARSRRPAALVFDTLTVEGALLSSALLSRIAAQGAPHQSAADYAIPPGLTLRDELARAFRIASALYQDFAAPAEPSLASTTAWLTRLFTQVLGFPAPDAEAPSPLTLSFLAGRVPVVVVAPPAGLDRPADTLTSAEGRRRSASSALQDWLNQREACLWGFASNGHTLRLLRDNPSLTRPAFVEVNLRQLFETENFADFTALWLLLHSSRFGLAAAPPRECPLELWRESGAAEGLVARDRLRDGVEQALLALGNGFLSHPANAALRERLASGVLPLTDFFNQLLRLIYRLIFLLVAEDRNLLHPPGAPAPAIALYAQGYSLSALRQLAVRRSSWDHHWDLWQGLLISFRALARGEARLALPPLGGLFDDVIPDLSAAALLNQPLMEAVYRLAWLPQESSLLPVNWRDMETEELGSVYESLLELTPFLAPDGRGLSFATGGEAKGHQRKTTGSYYTPDSLVQTLLDSALNPVLDRAEAAAADKERALLSLTVIDPACGSGHFLLSAARRLAARVARVRSGGVAAPADYRHALRDVVRNSIYGVDRNPLAVELTRVALWIETVEPGKPLGFLDANILCGDSLLGVFDLEVLREGIPDAAYKPLAGDDKVVARDLARRNSAVRGGQGSLDFAGGRSRLPAAPPLAAPLRDLRRLPEDSAADIARKRESLAAARRDQELGKWRDAADLYLAAFLLPKTPAMMPSVATGLIPTSEQVWQRISGGQVYGPLLGEAVEVAKAGRAFHWPLEFPDIMAAGGFDAVIGNPPWERIKLQEQEFFASRDAEIALAPTAALRGQAIEALRSAAAGSPGQRLYREFEQAKRTAEAASLFARASGRFPLTGQGDINTYALFAELFSALPKPSGRAGILVPTGIATDSTTSEFFGHLTSTRRLASLIDFENRDGLFPAIDSRIKFAILTLGADSATPFFAFFLAHPSSLAEAERRFTLTPEQLALINPNTRTAPIFRSRFDAELTAKIYSRVPCLLRQTSDGVDNPWGFEYMTKMFDMADSSGEFKTKAQCLANKFTEIGNQWVDPNGKRWVPLYEAKMIHLFDSRWITMDDQEFREVTKSEKENVDFDITPRYWVAAERVGQRLYSKKWERDWIMGWRDITNATNERTVIIGVYPSFGVGHTLRNVFLSVSPLHSAAFLACLSSLPFDYVARQKMGGTHLTVEVIQQLPVFPPCYFLQSHIEYLSRAVLELCYTSKSLKGFANDLEFHGPPFSWNEDRRAVLRAELDAWFARAYGLTRDELRFILDPADLLGPDYPSETFRVLKNNEMRAYGEYRTRRLVLEAWDRLEAGDLR